MAQNGGKKLLIIGSVIAIISVCTYLYIEQRKKKRALSGDGSETREPLPNNQSTPKSDTKPNENTGVGGGVLPYSPPVNPMPAKETVQQILDTTGKIQAFQNWLDANYPSWIKNGTLKQNVSRGYGNLGSQTIAAWDKYGDKYKTTWADANRRQKFPLRKKVLAKIDFPAYQTVYRNGDYYITDAKGNLLPLFKFKKTAAVGSIVGYSKSNPNALVVQMPNSMTNILVHQNYLT